MTRSATVKKTKSPNGKKSDPIGIYHRYIVDEKIATKADLDKIEEAIETEVAEAIEFAEASPDPGFDTLFDYMYASKE